MGIHSVFTCLYLVMLIRVLNNSYLTMVLFNSIACCFAFKWYSKYLYYKDILHHKKKQLNNILNRHEYCYGSYAAIHGKWAVKTPVPATVYPKKYAHGFVVLCFVVGMQSFIMNSHEVFIHIHQGCFAGTGAIVRLPQCQWSKPDGYGKISQCITTTKHSNAKTVCIFLGIYCIAG